MSTNGFSSLLGDTYGPMCVILVAWLLIAIIGVITFCVKMIKRTADKTQLRAELDHPTINLVQVCDVDGAKTEKFLQDLAMESPVRFTSKQLCGFTNSYSKRLGSGGFGVVYHGQFPNGIQIAVKVLTTSLDTKAEAQFMAEVGSIGRIYHVNLVKLYGFCYDHPMSALVYEYMKNGSLDKYMFSNVQVIEWEKLHDIAVGTAKGIAYLHEECHQRIIHYDIKPANVLLDANFIPKVADFGLAKLSNREFRDNTHDSTTGYRGTPGYSAPEFLLKNYRITHKCDVYSFGILLFEIVGRRQNATTASSDSLNWFPKHVWDEYKKGNLAAMTHACRIEEKDREKAERMSIVALWCVQDSPEARPSMSAVVKMLEGVVEIVPPPKPFRYLYSIGMDALKSPSKISNGSSSTSKETEADDSFWYKESTPEMAGHGIQLSN